MRSLGELTGKELFRSRVTGCMIALALLIGQASSYILYILAGAFVSIYSIINGRNFWLASLGCVAMVIGVIGLFLVYNSLVSRELSIWTQRLLVLALLVSIVETLVFQEFPATIYTTGIAFVAHRLILILDRIPAKDKYFLLSEKDSTP